MNLKIRNARVVLNGLLKINNDRMEGYQKSSDNTNEPDLKTVFKSMSDESKKNASALIREIERSGGDAVGKTIEVFGRVYRFWIWIKTLFTSNGRQSVLDSCERREDVAQAAYSDAISSVDLTTEARQMVRNQQASLKSFCDILRNFRDGHPIAYAKTI